MQWEKNWIDLFPSSDKTALDYSWTGSALGQDKISDLHYLMIQKWTMSTQPLRSHVMRCLVVWKHCFQTFCIFCSFQSEQGVLKCTNKSLSLYVNRNLTQTYSRGQKQCVFKWHQHLEEKLSIVNYHFITIYGYKTFGPKNDQFSQPLCLVGVNFKPIAFVDTGNNSCSTHCH